MHDIFSRHWLFDGLPEVVKATIYRNGEDIEVGAGDTLMDEGDRNSEMYVLLDGRFKVSLPDRPNRISDMTLGYRGPGDLLGEYSLLDGLPASATVTAEVPGEVFRISHESLRALLGANPEVSAVIYRNMLDYLVAHLRAHDEELDRIVL